jgi:hypothetical protein
MDNSKIPGSTAGGVLAGQSGNVDRKWIMN